MSMDLHPTPFPGKIQPVKSRFNQNISSKVPKKQSKETSLTRQNRAFGMVQNPNVPTKTVSRKPLAKSSSGVLQKPIKSPKKTQSLTDSIPNPVIESAKKLSTDENRVRLRKKSVCFQESKEKNSQEGNVSEPKTPAKSPNLVKPRLSGSTPFHSAEKCSKCRYDKLETSTYWLTQIKLAETVGKHFVSAAFFKLALESKAEPFRNILIELKKYMRRHKHLSEEKEWKEVCVSYGLLKDEMETANASKSQGKENENTIDKDESKELKQEVKEEENVSIQEGNEFPLSFMVSNTIID